MQNQDNPHPYVLASGEMHSIREFLEESLKVANIKYSIIGSGDSEHLIERSTGKLICEVDPKYYRPRRSSQNFAEIHLWLKKI